MIKYSPYCSLDTAMVLRAVVLGKGHAPLILGKKKLQEEKMAHTHTHTPLPLPQGLDLSLTNKEKLFNNHKLFHLKIISFILLILMFNSEVLL